jgi:hypothetical protein
MLDHEQAYRRTTVNIGTEDHNPAYFSGSTSVNESAGMTFVANSSFSKHPIVAMKPMSPATLACTNGSLSALENAGTSTLRFVLYPREGPRRPTRMQEFVRIDASGSD